MHNVWFALQLRLGSCLRASHAQRATCEQVSQLVIKMTAFEGNTRLAAIWLCVTSLLHAVMTFRRKSLSVTNVLVVSRVGSFLLFFLAGNGPAGDAARLLPFLEVLVGVYFQMQTPVSANIKLTTSSATGCALTVPCPTDAFVVQLSGWCCHLWRSSARAQSRSGMGLVLCAACRAPGSPHGMRLGGCHARVRILGDRAEATQPVGGTATPRAPRGPTFLPGPLRPRRRWALR